MSTDYERSSDKSHVTALTPAEWAELAARKRNDDYVLIWTNRAGEKDSGPLDYAEAMRQFGNVDQIRKGCNPHSSYRLRVVAEHDRVGAR